MPSAHCHECTIFREEVEWSMTSEIATICADGSPVPTKSVHCTVHSKCSVTTPETTIDIARDDKHGRKTHRQLVESQLLKLR